MEILQSMKRINEIFFSLQGEGFHVGTPSVFVRFSGCNLKCSFCDTSHESYREMSDDEIVEAVSMYNAPWVILTGGEPSIQVTDSLVDRLQKLGRKVAIETNGTFPIPKNLDWVTLSPKEDKSPILREVDEIKVVFQEDHDVEQWYEEIKANYYFLQPCSCLNTQKTIQYILQHPHWRLSLQIHKYVGID